MGETVETSWGRGYLNDLGDSSRGLSTQLSTLLLIASPGDLNLKGQALKPPFKYHSKFSPKKFPLIRRIRL
jgi:hypothetical protein